MGHLPCTNPSCKSEGQPHPNCKCHGGYANGGAVRFCSGNRAHEKNCKYYAEGGLVPESDLPSMQTSEEQQVPHDDLPESMGQEVPASDLPTNYGSPGQQAIAGLEGAAQGFAGPLATMAETKFLGVKPEDIAGRAASNPWTHGIGQAAGLGTGFATGAGEAGLIASGLEHALPEATSILGKIGSSALKGFAENSLIQGGDEVTHAMLGQGDPETPVSSALAHMGAAGLFGGLTGGIFSGVGQGATKGLKSLEAAKAGTQAERFLSGLGSAADATKNGEKLVTEADASRAYQMGVKAYNKMNDVIMGVASKSAGGLGAKIGGHIAGQTGAVIGWGAAEKLLGPIIENIVGKKISPKIAQYAYPAVLKALAAGESKGVWAAMDYATQAAKGAEKITKGVDSLFKIGGQRAIDENVNDNQRDRLKQFIEDGGVDQQVQNNQQQEPENFAKGGDVGITTNEPDHLSNIFPEQNILLNSAKGRISNYLNSQRPIQTAKLPFDAERKDVAKERSYNKAIDIAIQPLSILNKIKSGTVTPEDVKHFSKMYPELKNHLDKKMTKQVLEAQLKEERPDYHVRQGMSLFLGSPLESSMTPSSIQAAQATFVTGGQSQQEPMKNKKGTSSLNKVAQNYETGNDARLQRQQKG